MVISLVRVARGVLARLNRIWLARAVTAFRGTAGVGDQHPPEAFC